MRNNSIKFALSVFLVIFGSGVAHSEGAERSIPYGPDVVTPELPGIPYGPDAVPPELPGIPYGPPAPSPDRPRESKPVPTPNVCAIHADKFIGCKHYN